MTNYTSNPNRKDKAMALMRTAKEEALEAGRPWRFGYRGTKADEARKFARTYAGIIADGKPPTETSPFPGVVPKKGTATRANMRHMERCLKKAYEAHMTQFNIISIWVQKENELIRWYKRMQQEEAGGRKNTNPRSPDQEAYTRGAKRFSNFTTRGERDTPPPHTQQPRTNGGESREQSQHKVKKIVGAEKNRGGKGKTYGHKTEGRGERDKQERRGQAYEGSPTPPTHTKGIMRVNRKYRRQKR